MALVRERRRLPKSIRSMRLAKEFKSGLSMEGLAKKYGITRAEVERSVRTRLDAILRTADRLDG
jgi:Mor family transcriptional regulator